MSKKEQTIIVRCCVGCVIPEYSTLIGSGTYILKRTGTIIDEPYYDYEINIDLMQEFIKNNSEQLINYKLLEITQEKTAQELLDEKNPVKVDSLAGYSTEYQKKKY